MPENRDIAFRLTRRESGVLRMMADEELRSPSDQAYWILRKELERFVTSKHEEMFERHGEVGEKNTCCGEQDGE